MTPPRAAASGAVVVVLVVALAWVMAQPLLSPAAAAVRAVADGAAVTVLGLATVPFLDGPRYRDDLMRRASAPLVAAAAVWLIAELVRLMFSAAETADIAFARLTAHTAWEFVTATAAGRSGAVSVAAAALVCGAVMALRPVWPLRLAVAGATGGGLAARAVTGHFAEDTLTAAAVVVHALAAAVWCGILAALVVTVHSRGQWARVLPRFSQLSLVCVAVLLAGGTVSAAARLSAPADLVSTGYGRILLAKIIVTAALLGLAWRYRTSWVPSAVAHRVSAQASRTKSLTELVFMVVALTLAAALTVAG